MCKDGQECLDTIYDSGLYYDLLSIMEQKQLR